MLSLFLLNPAHADCMSPQAFFSTDPVVPQSATVFFFAPPNAAMQPRFTVLDAQETPVPFTAESLGGLLGAWQLKIEAATPGEITLSAAFSEDTWIAAQPMTLTVTADWQAPEGRSLTAMEVTSDIWPCSHQLSTDLKVTGTAPAAWAVEWAPSAEAWTAGQRQTDWLPGNLMGFYRHTGDRSIRLELGHISCLGDAFAWSGPEIIARVVAVDADGTYRPLLDTPTAIPRPK
ncbi:MAG: hypothetical protein ACI8RZ_003433 [Myxococcota bacterium]|jgi:hypothetical protein